MLRVGDPADWRDWRNLREVSRAFLTPWEPAWPDHALSYGYFCGNLRRHWREWREGKGYAFLIFGKSPLPPCGEGAGKGGPLLGGIALNNVERGVAQKGTLGYWIGQPYAGRGLMTEAAGLVCAFAFDELKLNRVEASCLPRNEPSRKLLEALAFEREGRARAWLRINGVWEDHLLWGRCAPSGDHQGSA
jgi:ribosomal-protein-alanine N-acetyltransferase